MTEVLEQHAPRLGLDRGRVDGEVVIAEQALLLVPDPVGFENIPPARGARQGQRHGGAE